MKHWAQNGLKALTSAWVLALLATVAWSQSLTWLGTLGGRESEAYGVSADGSVVVGWSYNAAGNDRAFRWTASGGMQDLGTLGGRESVALGASANGAVVVGSAQNAAGQWRAFRWTASGGMQDLGTLGGDGSVANGVSADGSVVVGWANNAAGEYRAFRWTASGGIEDLNLTYVYVLSCSVTPGSVLIAAHAVSSDGRYIVGTGFNAATGRREAFLLDTQAPFSPNGDVNRDGCVDDIDMMGVLFEFGELVNDFNRCVDVNRDGIIDDADLLIVLFNFGSGC
jgi:probable HAF family extracellular repeat protein